MADTPVVAVTPVKPGYQTTEFWGCAAVTLIGLLLASGIIKTGSGWDNIAGIALSALTQMGYAASRGNVKANQ